LYSYTVHKQLVFGVRPTKRVSVNPSEFYLWGYLNVLVYSTPLENEEKLHERTFDARQTIRNRHLASERVRQPMVSRVHSRIGIWIKDILSISFELWLDKQ